MHRRPVRRRFAAVAIASLTGLVLTGCGAGAGAGERAGSEEQAGSAATAEPAGSDVMFAQMMIPHHEQAIEMADLAPARTSSPQVLALAEDIAAAQGPEIDLMAGWLQSWGEEVPTPGSSTDHAGHGMGDGSMMGMMSAEDMAALAAANGAEFDRMWLAMMIAHHEGAVVMAEQVRDSSLAPVRDLADAIIAGQTAEIAQMQALLAR